jgi:hypothetical protein
MKSSTAPRTGLAKLVSTLPRLWAVSPATVGKSIAHRRRPTAFRRWASVSPCAGRVGAAPCAGSLPLAALLSPRIVVGRAVRNLRQQSEQRARDSDRVGVAQRLAGVTVTVDFGGAFRAERDVMRRAQVSVHSQLTVDKGGNGLDRQMLGRAELPWSTDRRIVLRGELGGEPGERSAEDMSPLDHHQLLSASRRVCAALPRM